MGLSWDEARRASYEEMLLLTGHYAHEELLNELTRQTHVVNGQAMADPKEQKKSLAGITREINKWNSWFHGKLPEERK